MAPENMDYLFSGLDEQPSSAAVEEIKQKEKERIAQLPAYDSQDKALAAAVQQKGVCEIWQEPRGGKFLVATPDTYEVLYRADYKKVMDGIEIADAARKHKPVKKAITYAQARKTE